MTGEPCFVVIDGERRNVSQVPYYAGDIIKMVWCCENYCQEILCQNLNKIGEILFILFVGSSSATDTSAYKFMKNSQFIKVWARLFAQVVPLHPGEHAGAVKHICSCRKSIANSPPHNNNNKQKYMVEPWPKCWGREMVTLMMSLKHWFWLYFYLEPF